MICFDGNKVSSRLKNMREQNDWSQSDLAQKLDERIGWDSLGDKGVKLGGVNGKQTVSQIERGARGVTINIAFAYADIFGVSLDYVLCRSDEWQANYKTTKELTGLSDEAIEALQNWNNMGNERYHLKYNINFINDFLSTKNIDSLFKEINDYIESVKICSFLKKTNEDIDFLVHGILSLNGSSEDIEYRNKILEDYHNEEKKAKYCHYEAWQLFTNFLDAYRESVKNNFDVDKYLDEQSKINNSLDEDRKRMNDLIMRLKANNEKDGENNGKCDEN